MDDDGKQQLRAAIQRILEGEGDQFRRIESLVDEVTKEDTIKRQILMCLIRGVRNTAVYDGILMMLDGMDIAKITAQLAEEQRDVAKRVQELFELQIEQMEKDAEK